MKNSCLSLMYHNVYHEKASFADLSPSVAKYFVGESQFESQIQKIASQTKVARMASLRGMVCNGELLPSDESIHISFDDGWQGTVDVAGPILESHNMEATIFVTTDFIGKKHFLSESQIKSLPNKTFQIGAHGKTHRILDQLNDVDLQEELTAPKKQLEDLCGVEIDTIACPGGGYNAKVRDMALEAGYKMIFTSRVDRIHPKTTSIDIPRLAIMDDTTEEAFDQYLKNDISKMIWRARALSIPKKILGRTIYDVLRSKLLGENKNQKNMVDLS